jgi:hypothetical protein
MRYLPGKNSQIRSGMSWEPTQSKTDFLTDKVHQQPCKVPTTATTSGRYKIVHNHKHSKISSPEQKTYPIKLQTLHLREFFLLNIITLEYLLDIINDLLKNLKF